jgi:hypothetical protein
MHTFGPFRKVQRCLRPSSKTQMHRFKMPTEAFKTLDGFAFAAVRDDPTVTDELSRSQASVVKLLRRPTGIFPDLYHLR